MHIPKREQELTLNSIWKIKLNWEGVRVTAGKLVISLFSLTHTNK